MLKLNIGFNRKMGEANFGSRGASVNLEIDVDSGVVREPEKLQAKIDYLFKLAKASVDAQLNGKPAQQTPPATSNGSNGNGSSTSANANGHGSTNGSSTNANGNGAQASGDGNGNGHSSNGNGFHATDKQLNYASQLAKGIRGLGASRLESLTGRMFGKPLTELTNLDASSLIDTLKAIKDGRVSLDAAMRSEGTAA